MLDIPNSVYDYLLFYECAAKDWVGGTNKVEVAKNNPGGLVNCINWNVSGTTASHDSGGNTKCGITHKTWSNWFNKNKDRYGLKCTSNVDSMDKNGWLRFVGDWWKSAPGSCANAACAIVLYQAKWGGWSNLSPCLNKLITEGKKNNPDYKFSGRGYSGIANATHAFKNPMDAFQIIRNYHQQYLYDLSAPGKSNSANRVGWMRREIATFQDDGLYVEPGLGELCKSSNSSLTIQEWKALCKELIKQGKIIKICSWDNMPTNPDTFDVDVSMLLNSNDTGSGSSSGGLDDDSPYVPKFSSSMRTDPHLSAHKDTEIKKGILLGSEFKVK